jgi:hypothetical protein
MVVTTVTQHYASFFPFMLLAFAITAYDVM